MNLKLAVANLLAAWGDFDAALKADPATAGTVPAPAPAPAVDAAWPHVIQAGGINIMAYAPLNPVWRTSNMSTLMLGGAYGPGFGGGVAFVSDPSNGMLAKPAMPVRSPAGFPLSYSLDRDGKVIGSASVSYGEHAFNNDAEVLDYIKRVEDPARFETASTWTDVTGRIAAQGPVALPPSPPAPAPVGGEVPIEV